MKNLSLLLLSGLLLVLTPGCDPDEDPIVTDTGLIGLWRAQSAFTTATTTLVVPSSAPLITSQRNVSKDPITYTIRFEEDPDIVTSSGIVTFDTEITSPDGTVTNQTVTAAVDFSNGGGTYVREGDLLHIVDRDGDTFTSRIVTLTASRLEILAEIRDTTPGLDFITHRTLNYVFEKD